MMAGGGGSAVAGGSALHIPVLGGPAVDFLNVRDGGVYIDGTFGAGGYTRRILAAANCKIVAIDRDQSAVARGAGLVEDAQGRLTLIEDRFSNLDTIAREAGYDAIDGVVLDLGVSSMQLDTAGRGFSFRLDGPLDMRTRGCARHYQGARRRADRNNPRARGYRRLRRAVTSRRYSPGNAHISGASHLRER
jgi:16S rRNA (cytosine1402-N4)-methyltransferase